MSLTLRATVSAQWKTYAGLWHEAKKESKSTLLAQPFRISSIWLAQ